MPRKVGFAMPCAGHFIQQWQHEIDTDTGKQIKQVYMIEGETAGEPFETLEEAEAWCKANPKKPEPKR